MPEDKLLTMIDISILDLVELEEVLYANKILTYNRDFYIRGAAHPVDEATFNSLQREYPNLCRIGRSFFPLATFSLLKLIVDTYQLDNSNCSNIIKRDPAGIDGRNLLDNDLDSNDILIGALSKLNSGINETLVYSFKSNIEVQNDYIGDIFNKLTTIESVLNVLEVMAKKNIYHYLLKIKNGIVYDLELTKNGILLKELGDVLHLRYKNIIEINRKKMKEQFYQEIDEEEELLEKEMENDIEQYW